ncbi:MAG: hypothetical protein ISP16_01335 [Candidatus Aquiluna sp.]|nr:hypothetical protein [Aquiluna sp.]
MAKGGFWAFLGGLGAAMWREGTKQRRQLEENYRREVRKATSEHAEEQAEYDAYVTSLPKLKGNGRFDQEVDTTYGDVFALDAYNQYLELMHEPGQHFTVFLELQEGEEEGSIRVDGGQATLGHIPYEDEGYLMEFLEELGGDVTCDAKLAKLVHGGYDLHLDIARPPTLID